MLSLIEFVSLIKYLECVIGMYFIYLVFWVDFVEIICGLKIFDFIFDEIRRFVEEVVDKKGVMIYEFFGFVMFRLICLLINEVFYVF